MSHPPPNCSANHSAGGGGADGIALGLTSVEEDPLPDGIECFEPLTLNQTDDFYEFERSMAYATAILSFAGVVGNVLAVVVLLSKDMRKNCFSQLLTGRNQF